MERPCSWPAHFGRSAPLRLEVGFGTGEYLCRQAGENPELNYLGIDLHWGSVSRTLRRVAQLELANVRLVQTDVKVALERLLAPRSLSHFCALFPCPWPKRKHERHRLFSNEFMRLLNSRCQDGTEALIVTDHEGLHEYILKNLPETGWDWRLELAAPRFNTKYERRWSDEGQQQFYEFHLKKREHVEVAPPEEVPLVTFHVPHFDPDNFAPQSERGDFAVEFKQLLYDPKKEVGMQLAVAIEEGMTQAFWIEIVRSRQGWAISPAMGAGVVPCRSVHRALELAGEACKR